MLRTVFNFPSAKVILNSFEISTLRNVASSASDYTIKRFGLDLWKLISTEEKYILPSSVPASALLD